MKAETLAEKILLIYYGGARRTSNNEFGMQMVMLMVQTERDFVVREMVTNSSLAGAAPEASLFTHYDSVPVDWDDTSKYYYCEVPDGYLSIPDDKGINIGIPGYVRAPYGWSMTRPDIAWAEGNTVWELRPPSKGGKRRIAFPNMVSKPDSISLDVIIGNTQGAEDSESGIPDGLEALVEERVLNKMGFKRTQVDSLNDNREEK